MIWAISAYGTDVARLIGSVGRMRQAFPRCSLSGMVTSLHLAFTTSISQVPKTPANAYRRTLRCATSLRVIPDAAYLDALSMSVPQSAHDAWS